VRSIDRHGSVFPRHPSHGQCAPTFKRIWSPIGRTDRFRALIQADRVSIMDRPHSNRTARPHRAPSFKWIGSASSCRALNHAGPPRPHSSDLIAPRGARPHSKDLSDPPSNAPSFKASGLHAPGHALNQAIKQSGLRSQVSGLRSQVDSPISVAPHSSGFVCAKAPKHYLGK
jgi:hypothetical protein